MQLIDLFKCNIETVISELDINNKRNNMKTNMKRSDAVCVKDLFCRLKLMP